MEKSNRGGHLIFISSHNIFSIIFLLFLLFSGKSLIETKQKSRSYSHSQERPTSTQKRSVYFHPFSYNMRDLPNQASYSSLGSYKSKQSSSRHASHTKRSQYSSFMFSSTPFRIINMFCKPNTIFLIFSFIIKQQFFETF